MGLGALQSLLYRQLQQDEAEADHRFEAVIGLVTDNKDPDKLGRVKVKLPTITESETTWWAPVVSAGAGKNRGWFFLPEVDDEVLVLFEHGDINHPVVIGALWNGKDKPPDNNPGGNPRRVICSRQGSRLVLDDENDQIVLEDGAGKGRITLDARANKIVVEALDGDLCVQAPAGELKLVAQQAELMAMASITINTGTTLDITTDATGTLGGKALLQLTSPIVRINSGATAAPAATAAPQDIPEKYGS
jgi:uncharacterized protein involved in type VI secretion and phage assembly